MADVFISYRQINEDHKTRVREFAEDLRDCGLDVMLDQFYAQAHPGGPSEGGWPAWSQKQAAQEQRVLIIASKGWFDCYNQKQPRDTGLGAAAEALVIRNRIYQAGGINKNIRIVYFDDQDQQNIPLELDGYHRFHAQRDILEIIKWLHSSKVPDDFCVAERIIRHSRPFRSEAGSVDTSDLHLLFLSVKDCNESRKLIKQYLYSLGHNAPCRPQGMYHLLGKWDLLVRLRISSNPDYYVEAIRDKLKIGLQTDEDDFSDYAHLNVLTEAKSLKELMPLSSARSVPLQRTVLGGTAEYEKQRCQRGVVYIRLKQTVEDKQDVINTLSKIIEDDKIFPTIIEGIYLAATALVIETFMSCFYSQELNRLNRRIEDILAKKDLQKYTMFCYGYDEESLQ